MKMRITNVKSVVREIVVERLNEYSFQRNKYKFPTAEDQARIQKEFGMKIDFSICMCDNDEYLNKRWYKDTKEEKSLFPHIVGISIKEVHSTLDDDYSIIIATMNFFDSSIKPEKYMAMAYGPKELVKQSYWTMLKFVTVIQMI